MVSHKPGPLKQVKKAHKHGKHNSKSVVSVKSKGRVGGGAVSRTTVSSVRKIDRKNKCSQLRKVKQCLVAEEKKGLGGSGQPPICVAFLPSNQDVDVSKILETLQGQGETHSVSENGFYFYCKKLKKRFHFISAGSTATLFDQLDIVKCADLVVLVWDSSYEMDLILKTCLFAQGLPSLQHVVTGHTVSNDREKIARKKNMTDIIERLFSSRDSKVHYLDKEGDVGTLLWGMANFKHQKLSFLKHRSCVISSEVDYKQITDTAGTLQVTGYIRGRSMDADQLVHIPGHGHFKIQKICSAPDPLKKQTDMFESVPLSTPTSSSPTLDMECPVDDMDTEQTWPTEEELLEAEQNSRHIKRVPKGTSSYQAVWMLSDDSEEEGEGEGDEMISEGEDEESEEEFEDVDTESQAATEGDYDVNFDEELEAEELKKFREANENEAFPDEVDTPIDVPARVRFQKFRGLKSFRTSPWDPKENLPLDYARISQIQNFNNIRKYLLKAQLKEEKRVAKGEYVSIFIEDVPLSVTESCSSALVVFSLLPHEQKMCVQHAVLHRHLQSDLVVKSKDSVLAQVGFRRYIVRPIYSQHTKSNKHKLERFMPTSGSFVSSYYAPITLSNSPVILFKQEENGSVTLLSTGSMLSCNPDRVICKRVVLSGHPFKVHKKTATIRYLFHNREDITYFKPIEVKTKHGRRGHIKAALGTHGHCKIGFDGPIQQNDTVIMCLYKRVFPKWDFQYS